jgi:hypothetical protein
MMPPDSVTIVVHAFCHLNDDERPLKGWDQAPLDRSLSSEIMGETEPDVAQRLLVEHDRLLGLFRVDVAEFALRDPLSSQLPTTRGPDRSISDV